MEATEALARYLVTSRWEDIPERVRHEAARALLNFMGCAIGASRHETVGKPAYLLKTGGRKAWR